MSKLKKIISGGQSGVDQAALQVAIDLEIEHGGWCPPGKVCENGIIPPQFKLLETPKECDDSATHIPRSQRTIWNVKDSDGSLIFLSEKLLDKGTELSIKTSEKLEKPYLIVDPSFDTSYDIIQDIQKWIRENKIEILSVGGPSELSQPGIYKRTYSILTEVLSGY